MACSTAKEKQCLLCMHSIIGDPCYEANKFSECAMEQLSDRICVYKVKVNILTDQVEKAKRKNKLGEDTQNNVKSLNKACKIKKFLENKQRECLELEELKKQSFKDIKTKEIVNNKHKCSKFDFMKICNQFKKHIIETN